MFVQLEHTKALCRLRHAEFETMSLYTSYVRARSLPPSLFCLLVAHYLPAASWQQLGQSNLAPDPSLHCGQRTVSTKP